jgi:hypothetical protein
MRRRTQICGALQGLENWGSGMADKTIAELRTLLTGLGFSPEKIEHAISVRRKRPHPSEKPPHRLKGKKRKVRVSASA